MGDNSNGNNYNDDNASSQQQDDGVEYLSEIQQKSTITGAFGIDPLEYTQFCVFCLSLYALYLFVPRGIRFTHCGSYPKRYAWSARSKRRRRKQYYPSSPTSVLPTYKSGQGGVGGGYADSTAGTGSAVSVTESSTTMNTNHRELSAQGIGTNGNFGSNRFVHQSHQLHETLPEEEVVDFTSPQQTTSIYRNRQYTMNTPSIPTQQNTPFSSSASTFNDEIAISTTMQQLRDTGVKIIAHGSKGKPKAVRLLLTENAIEWRTESSKKKNKVGKTHQVPLSHIMYVDVGKQTTALRRVENASIAENVCLSLLTRDGSLDLEASSAQERDALVNCFSLVLDEVHAKNWRDVYRAPSSDLPSSFDEFDMGASTSNMDERMEV
jgi:hypothetical protein